MIGRLKIIFTSFILASFFIYMIGFVLADEVIDYAVWSGCLAALSTWCVMTLFDIYILTKYLLSE